MEVVSLLDQVAKLGSPQDKADLIRLYPYQETLKKVFRAALDPFITYGITDFESGVEPSKDDPMEVLELLASRNLTGTLARTTLGAALKPATPEDRELFRRILKKDLRCGVGPALVELLYPGLLRQFGIMRADKFKTLVRGAQYYIEPKLDGLRSVSIIEKRRVTILSRNGHEFTSSDHLKPQLLDLMGGQDGVIDGELKNGVFNQSSSAVRKKGVQNDGTVLHAFDFMTLDEWKNPTRGYVYRRRDLTNLFRIPQKYPGLLLVPSYPISNEDEAYKYYHKFLDDGDEGAIVKRGDGTYHQRRHRDWMKMKAVNDVDLRVEKIIQGEGKYHGMMGAAIVSYKGKRNSIGTGWSDEERAAFWKNPKLIVNKIIEIHFHEVTPDGNLRHSRFHRIREDKLVPDF